MKNTFFGWLGGGGDFTPLLVPLTRLGLVCVNRPRPTCGWTSCSAKVSKIEDCHHDPPSHQKLLQYHGLASSVAIH
jgi:hypothetical protein